MTKSELILNIARKNPNLDINDVERIVSTVFCRINDSLAEGGRVELRGFGCFTVRHWDARQVRNPKTGETLFVGQRRTPFFKARKKILSYINTQPPDAVAE